MIHFHINFIAVGGGFSKHPLAAGYELLSNYGPCLIGCARSHQKWGFVCLDTISKLWWKCGYNLLCCCYLVVTVTVVVNVVTVVVLSSCCCCCCCYCCCCCCCCMQHHSYRSFQGFTCLMQLSTRSHDYIVDTLAVRHHMQLLLDPFTDPAILKARIRVQVLWQIIIKERFLELQRSKQSWLYF